MFCRGLYFTTLMLFSEFHQETVFKCEVKQESIHHETNTVSLSYTYNEIMFVCFFIRVFVLINTV